MHTLANGNTTTWLILYEDGTHVLVGRHSEPSGEELAAIGAKLAAGGVGGWLTALVGDYWRRGDVELRPVSQIARSPVAYQCAVELFHAIRRDRLAS